MKLLFVLLLTCQFPGQPDKQLPQAAAPVAPSKAPQAAFATPQATPQASFTPQYDEPAVVLQAAPRVYAVQRQVIVQAAPVLAYASADVCVAHQAVVVQRAAVHHAVVQRAVVARAPRKVVTKSRTVTKTRRGLFGRG